MGGWLRSLAAFAVANARNLLFTGALAVASIGFALAWPPLGLIFPGLLVCCLMAAWHWQQEGKKDDDA